MTKKEIQLKEKIRKTELALMELRAELSYWERLKALAMQEKLMGGGGKCSGKQ